MAVPHRREGAQLHVADRRVAVQTLSVTVDGAALRWLGSSHLVSGSYRHCRPRGLAFVRCADIRWEGPTGVT